MWEQPNLSRREFLARAGNGFGLLALADLLAGQRRAARLPNPTARPTPTPSGLLTITPTREAVHLPLHARRAVAHRPVRSQAEAGRDERPAAAVRKAEARAHQDRQPAGLAVEVRRSTASAAPR